MVVIADSSPLNYLVLIDVIQILPELFGQVFIPAAVSRELQSAATPPKVAAWMSQSPNWLHMEKAAPLDDEHLEKLGAGEREAITLALASRSDALLLIDEGRGRREAKQRRIRFMGTLGVLDKAAAAGLIDLPSVIDRLLQTNFYVTPSLLKTLLVNDASRKKSASSHR
jgi:predicted nucleic acid-binding protein